jgi:hypothetical protein
MTPQGRRPFITAGCILCVLILNGHAFESHTHDSSSREETLKGFDETIAERGMPRIPTGSIGLTATGRGIADRKNRERPAQGRFVASERATNLPLKGAHRCYAC